MANCFVSDGHRRLRDYFRPDAQPVVHNTVRLTDHGGKQLVREPLPHLSSRTLSNTNPRQGCGLCLQLEQAQRDLCGFRNCGAAERLRHRRCLRIYCRLNGRCRFGDRDPGTKDFWGISPTEKRTEPSHIELFQWESASLPVNLPPGPNSLPPNGPRYLHCAMRVLLTYAEVSS